MASRPFGNLRRPIEVCMVLLIVAAVAVTAAIHRGSARAEPDLAAQVTEKTSEMKSFGNEKALLDWYAKSRK